MPPFRTFLDKMLNGFFDARTVITKRTISLADSVQVLVKFESSGIQADKDLDVLER